MAGPRSRFGVIIALGFLFIFASCTSSNNSTPLAGDTPASVESQLTNGAPIYKQTCATSTCHGTQGEGISSGKGFKVWPLVGDEFQSRHPNAQIVFDVIRSGSERNLLASTDQQIYDAIAYELSQNQIKLDSPLTADNAFATIGEKMSGEAQGGLFPPSDNANLIDLPPIRDLPIVAENERLRVQVDQIAQASPFGDDQGVYLIFVLAFSDLDDEPSNVSPNHLNLLTPSGELLEPQPVNIKSAIEKFHTRTIKLNYGTVGLVVFNLPAPDQFDQLIYDNEAGDRLTLALKP